MSPNLPLEIWSIVDSMLNSDDQVTLRRISKELNGVYQPDPRYKNHFTTEKEYADGWVFCHSENTALTGVTISAVGNYDVVHHVNVLPYCFFCQHRVREVGWASTFLGRDPSPPFGVQEHRGWCDADGSKVLEIWFLPFLSKPSKLSKLTARVCGMCNDIDYSPTLPDSMLRGGYVMRFSTIGSFLNGWGNTHMTYHTANIQINYVFTTEHTILQSEIVQWWRPWNDDTKTTFFIRSQTPFLMDEHDLEFEIQAREILSGKATTLKPYYHITQHSVMESFADLDEMTRLLSEYFMRCGAQDDNYCQVCIRYFHWLKKWQTTYIPLSPYTRLTVLQHAQAWLQHCNRGEAISLRIMDFPSLPDDEVHEVHVDEEVSDGMSDE
jgi:hypothetical protein